MQALVLERKPLGTVTVDLCGDCQALWFDAFESLQLTPGAVIALFEAIHATQPRARQAAPARLRCPRCTDPLVLTYDQTNAARFTYHRCPHGHGRFTPFFQFLREKSFVRPLPDAELARLKAHVRVVHCSSCGAPVDLERNTVCSYCHAPIAVLDPDAVSKALETYRASEIRRQTIDPVALVDGILAAQRADTESPTRRVDLVALGLTVVHDILSRGH